jgi:hypothetical protein
MIACAIVGSDVIAVVDHLFMSPRGDPELMPRGPTLSRAFPRRPPVSSDFPRTDLPTRGPTEERFLPSLGPVPLPPLNLPAEGALPPEIPEAEPPTEVPRPPEKAPSRATSEELPEGSVSTPTIGHQSSRTNRYQ